MEGAHLVAEVRQANGKQSVPHDSPYTRHSLVGEESSIPSRP